MTDTRTEPDSEQVWRHMLVSKYTGIVDGGNTAIAHGVYVARVGRKPRTRLNNGISVQLGWLDQVSGHASPHHHAELSHMWQVLAQQGYDPNARVPAMCRAESEIATAIGHHVPKGAPRESATERALAAVAALQSTGHLGLVTAPAPSYDKDLALAVSEGSSPYRTPSGLDLPRQDREHRDSTS